jgi:hypothetical protein
MLVVYRRDVPIEDAGDEKVHIPVIPVSMLVVYRRDGSIEDSKGRKGTHSCNTCKHVGGLQKGWCNRGRCGMKRYIFL